MRLVLSPRNVLFFFIHTNDILPDPPATEPEGQQRPATANADQQRPMTARVAAGAQDIASQALGMFFL